MIIAMHFFALAGVIALFFAIAVLIEQWLRK